MNPMDKYHWSCRMIRRLLKLAHLDVFEHRFRYSIGYFVVFSLFAISLLGSCYTICVFDIVTGLFSIACLFDMVGVRAKFASAN